MLLTLAFSLLRFSASKWSRNIVLILGLVCAANLISCAQLPPLKLNKSTQTNDVAKVPGSMHYAVGLCSGAVSGYQVTKI